MKLLMSLICLSVAMSAYALPTKKIELESITVKSEVNLIRVKHIDGVGENPEVKSFEISDNDGLATLALVNQAYNYSNELELNLQRQPKLRYAMETALKRLKNVYKEALEQEDLKEDFKIKVAEISGKLDLLVPDWNNLQTLDKVRLNEVILLAGDLHAYDIMDTEKEESQESGLFSGDHILSKSLKESIFKLNGKSSAGVFPAISFYADTEFDSEDGGHVTPTQFGAGN